MVYISSATMTYQLRQVRSYDYLGEYDYYTYDSNDTNSSFYEPYDNQGAATIYYYKAFDFEEPVYLYLWIPMIIFTTLTNILILLVLTHRRMRSATNTILIAIAISDSMTGLVTVPGLIYAFNHRVYKDLALTHDWCKAFMILRYFFSRYFHTISIWLTVILGLQRLVSVSYPFKAQTIFSTRNTMISIVLVTLVAPFLHIYHLFNSKTIKNDPISFCEWIFENPCKETCAYFWLSVFLMHFVPCGLLIVFTISMIGQMKDAARRMQESKMITNQQIIDRRHMESRRITCIVVAVVVVFLIPEVPYGVFLTVTAVFNQQSKFLLDKETNREIICAYEILLVLTFQANFWIYVIMNRKFRRGLKLLLDPVLALVNSIFGRVGIEPVSRPRLGSTTTASGGKIPVTRHSKLSVTNSFRATGQDQTRLSRSSSEPKETTALEMRTYSFSTNNNQITLHEMEKVDSESELAHTEKE